MRRVWVLTLGLMQLALPLFFVITAIGKFMAWEEFESSLGTYSLVPVPVRMFAAVLVPAGETAAFVLYLLRLRVWANVLCACVLLVFLVVTYWHWRLNVPPDCSCMGLWAQYWKVDESAMGVMTRDSYMLGYIAFVLVMTGCERVSDRSGRVGENEQAQTSGRIHAH